MKLAKERQENHMVTHNPQLNKQNGMRDIITITNGNQDRLGTRKLSPCRLSVKDTPLQGY